MDHERPLHQTCHRWREPAPARGAVGVGRRAGRGGPVPRLVVRLTRSVCVSAGCKILLLWCTAMIRLNPTVWQVECSLLPRRPCRFGGARRPRAWCRRRPAALAAQRRAASVTSRALRGVFRHARAWHRRQEARLPCLRPRACSQARQARRRSARVFELADPRRASMARRSTGACPARSRHSVQPRQGVWEGRQGQRGPSRARWRAGCYHDYELSVLRSGRRRRACAARCSTAGCSPTFQQCLLHRFSRCNRLRGPAPAASPRKRCLRLRHAHRLAARVACGGPAGRDARRERAQQAVQRSLTHLID